MPASELKLSAAEKASWANDGYFVRMGQFTERELEVLRRASDRAAGKACRRASQGREYVLDGKRFVDIGPATVQFEHEPDSAQVRVLEPAHLFDPGLDALVDDPRLTLPMMDLVGADTLALWTSKLNLKHAQGSAFPWHQDSPYWMHDCDHVDRLPNVMLALDPQTEGNGCFRIIRGSHRSGILPGTADGSQLGGFYTSPDHVDEANEVSMQVDAGALIFFSPHTVHGSSANRSSEARRALIFTYQPGAYPMLKNAQLRKVENYADCAR